MLRPTHGCGVCSGSIRTCAVYDGVLTYNKNEIVAIGISCMHITPKKICVRNAVKLGDFLSQNLPHVLVIVHSVQQ